MIVSPNNITLAFTGASGIGYGLRLLEQLVCHQKQISLLITEAGFEVFKEEAKIILPKNPQEISDYFTEKYQAKNKQITVYHQTEWSAPIASGSNTADAMVVCPCTTGSLSAFSVGASNNLLERAFDVMLKEDKPLILVVRETPLSVIHLEHMLRLAKLGVCILPPSPGFYLKPQSVQDLMDFVVARILDRLKIPHDLNCRWGAR